MENGQYGTLELFFACMNSPMVGRNLLGDESYRWFIDRLGDNDPVLLVVSRGASPESTREPVWVGRWKERW